MNFVLDEEQLAIARAAREMLIESCTPKDLRRLLADKRAIDAARWQTMGEMGLLGSLAPAAAGGSSLALVDFVGIAEAAGYVALPEPLVEQAGIAIPLLATLSDGREWLRRAVDGTLIAVGHPVNPCVQNADLAAALLLADGDRLHLVERADVSVEPVTSIDPFRRLFHVRWSPSARTELKGGWGATAERGAILAAAELLGLAQRCVDLAVDYAKQRTQFGKPIGSYQAVKHLLANAQVKIEFARPVVYAAAAEMPLGNLASRARAAHAKIAAGAAADLAARTSVQVHGAMGITWEVDVHFFLKRALALNFAWGTPAQHRKTVLERIHSFPTGPAASFASESVPAVSP